MDGFALCFILHPSSFCLHPVWLCPAFQGSRFEVRGSKFGVHHNPSEYNSLPVPPSGWSGGTLDKPWTCPIPIEPPQTPVFDQPSLSRPLACGISAAERFRCAADRWSADARSFRLCGSCSSKPDIWAAFPGPSALFSLRLGVALGGFPAGFPARRTAFYDSTPYQTSYGKSEGAEGAVTRLLASVAISSVLPLPALCWLR